MLLKLDRAVRRRWRLAALVAVLLSVSALSAGPLGQRGGRGGGNRGGGGRGGRNGGLGGFAGAGSTLERWATADDFDGSFHFCRLAFRNAQGGDGGGWGVDYPRADQNLSIRLSELTRLPVSMDNAGDPKPLLFQAIMPELTHCPFVMMTEPGGAYFDEQEAAALRSYLQRGGFLWADDFWGEYAWQFWESMFRKVLPSGQYPIYDVPLTHPIFTQLMTVAKVPQIPSIGVWEQRRVTSERGGDSAVPHVRAINDDHGRMMVLMTHNTDFGDSYEREGDDHEYFERFSVPGYAFGINVVVYVLTH